LFDEISMDISFALHSIELEEKRKQDEEQIKFLSSVVKQSSDGMAIADLNGKLLFVNQAWKRMHGFEEAENLIGKNLSIFHNEEQLRNEVEPFKRRVIEKGFNTGEVGHIRKDGSVFPTQMTVSLLKDENGNPIAMASVAADITKRKETEQMLIQSEKMASIGFLAAGITHEINNPIGFIDSNLNTMDGYIEKINPYLREVRGLVETTAGEKAAVSGDIVNELKSLEEKYKIGFILQDLKDIVKESLEGTARVKKIVSDLRDFSRIEKSEFEPADINEIIQKSLNLVWNELKYKAEIIKEFGSLPKTECIPQRLEQVFINLLLNAAQAIEVKGTIRIKTFAVQNAVKVQISDTGKGIPKAHLDKVFDAFFTTKDPGKGTGLGLSISHRIIQDHRGNIEVESEEGAGATVTVTLPIRKTDKHEKLKVVIVDDDAGVRKALSRMLSELYPFWYVREAESAFDAVNLMNLFEPDLILLDIKMPGISGLEMCNKIKASKEHGGIKVIMITGVEDDDLREKSFAAGADAFLRKPMDRETVKQTILEVMRGGEETEI